MNKTPEELKKLLEEYIIKYNSNEDNIRKNDWKLQYIDNAIDIIKKDGSLDEQIARNKEELTKLGYNPQLRDENSINLMTLNKDRKKLEEQNEIFSDIISDINRLLEKAKSTDEMVEILNNYKKEIYKVKEQEENLLVINNIEKICQTKKSKLTEDKVNISSKTKEIEDIINDVRKNENNISKYDLVSKLGILTPDQKDEIDKNINNIADLTQKFTTTLYGEKSDKKESKQEQLSSTKMEQKLNEENSKDLKCKDDEIAKLDKIIVLIDQFKKSKKIELEPHIPTIQNDMAQEKPSKEQNNEKLPEVTEKSQQTPSEFVEEKKNDRPLEGENSVEPLTKDTNNSDILANSNYIYDMPNTNASENNNDKFENPYAEQIQKEEQPSSLSNNNYGNAVYDDIFGTQNMGETENNNNNYENPHYEEQPSSLLDTNTPSTYKDIGDINKRENNNHQPNATTEIIEPPLHNEISSIIKNNSSGTTPETLDEIIEGKKNQISKDESQFPILEQPSSLSNNNYGNAVYDDIFGTQNMGETENNNNNYENPHYEEQPSSLLDTNTPSTYKDIGDINKRENNNHQPNATTEIIEPPLHNEISSIIKNNSFGTTPETLDEIIEGKKNQISKDESQFPILEHPLPSPNDNIPPMIDDKSEYESNTPTTGFAGIDELIKNVSENGQLSPNVKYPKSTSFSPKITAKRKRPKAPIDTLDDLVESYDVLAQEVNNQLSDGKSHIR